MSYLIYFRIVTLQQCCINRETSVDNVALGMKMLGGYGWIALKFSTDTYGSQMITLMTVIP